MSARPGHPRACGENGGLQLGLLGGHRAIPARAGRTRREWAREPAMRGPSPRVRGERRRSPGLPWHCRPGHPRACGENPEPVTDRPGAERAIPARAGRTEELFLVSPRRARAIPARAGRTYLPGDEAIASVRAIPARAGRTSWAKREASAPCGPSPRVRGEQGSAHRWRCGCAGHPRACGENGADQALQHRRSRAIPARAGRTTTLSRSTSWPSGPSPRVRGELGYV